MKDREKKKEENFTTKFTHREEREKTQGGEKKTIRKGPEATERRKKNKGRRKKNDWGKICRGSQYQMPKEELRELGIARGDQKKILEGSKKNDSKEVAYQERCTTHRNHGREGKLGKRLNR